ncbi:hypothetical protein RvY_02439 [Ramazzottius varieornatus]|uniref:Corticotropin-releasing factor domain-containing protein n=1 Tax=Ramazzottius varieornatus TaxID=947166 RepID=A0A1D1UUU6_RAMVA|nr:hypothetical protein RvY_02439 [Ramazzottius varieornatus]
MTRSTSKILFLVVCLFYNVSHNHANPRSRLSPLVSSVQTKRDYFPEELVVRNNAANGHEQLADVLPVADGSVALGAPGFVDELNALQELIQAARELRERQGEEELLKGHASSDFQRQQRAEQRKLDFRTQGW